MINQVNFKICTHNVFKYNAKYNFTKNLHDLF